MRRIRIEAQNLNLLYPSERYAIQDLVEKMGMIKVLTLIEELYPEDFEKALKQLK